MNTIDKLNRLSDLQAGQAAIHLHFDSLREEVLTPEIKDKLAEIEAEEKTAIETISQGIVKLTDEIKVEVLVAGASIKGDNLQAVFSKGRISWDTKALDGYAAGHPEIIQFRKVGDPSISIRGIK